MKYRKERLLEEESRIEDLFERPGSKDRSSPSPEKEKKLLSGSEVNSQTGLFPFETKMIDSGSPSMLSTPFYSCDGQENLSTCPKRASRKKMLPKDDLSSSKKTTDQNYIADNNKESVELGKKTIIEPFQPIDRPFSPGQVVQSMEGSYAPSMMSAFTVRKLQEQEDTYFKKEENLEREYQEIYKRVENRKKTTGNYGHFGLKGLEETNAKPSEKDQPSLENKEELKENPKFPTKNSLSLRDCDRDHLLRRDSNILSDRSVAIKEKDPYFRNGSGQVNPNNFDIKNVSREASLLNNKTKNTQQTLGKEMSQSQNSFPECEDVEEEFEITETRLYDFRNRKFPTIISLGAIDKITSESQSGHERCSISKFNQSNINSPEEYDRKGTLVEVLSASLDSNSSSQMKDLKFQRPFEGLNSEKAEMEVARAPANEIAPIDEESFDDTTHLLDFRLSHEFSSGHQTKRPIFHQ